MINFLNIKKHCSEYHANKSSWAYFYCINIKDRPEIRKYITDSGHAYLYCMYFKDDTEVAKYITDLWNVKEYHRKRMSQLNFFAKIKEILKYLKHTIHCILRT